MDIKDIKDIKDVILLKSMKADEYDRLNEAQQILNISSQNIQILANRIKELQSEEFKEDAADEKV